MKYLLVIWSIFGLPSVYAIECEWWQTKIRTHIVGQHERGGSKVKTHPRQEHCRERWQDADKLIKQFKNASITGWPLKEKFKPWKKEEIQIILENLSSLPTWTDITKYRFYRAENSIQKGNPTTSEVTHGSIILYDQFFDENDKAIILVHESGHHLFKKLTISEIEEFATLSGWKEEIDKDRQVFILPPNPLIKSDSAISKEEDFTNHLEVFFRNPKDYKKNYPKNFEFFQKRYPL